MSMNLNLSIEGQHYDLYQTPTFISEILMTTDDGNYRWMVRGKRAQGVLQRYVLWAKGRVGREHYSNNRDWEANRELVNEHIEKLLKATEGKRLEFYVQ